MWGLGMLGTAVRLVWRVDFNYDRWRALYDDAQRQQGRVLEHREPSVELVDRASARIDASRRLLEASSSDRAE